MLLVHVLVLFQVVNCYFDGENMPTQVLKFGDLTYGHTINGPAIIVDESR